LESLSNANYLLFPPSHDSILLFFETYNCGKMQDRYQWAGKHVSLVNKAYWDKRKNRLKDRVCKLSTKKLTDVIPWLSPNVRRHLQHHKPTSIGFLKRSRQSKLNKVIGPKVVTHHIQGSVSTSTIAKKRVRIYLFRLCFNNVRPFTTFSCLHNFRMYSHSGKQER